MPEQVPEYKSEGVYERSEELDISSTSPSRFTSDLYNPGPASNLPMPSPAACADPIGSHGPDISPVQELSNLIPTSNLSDPIPENDLSRPATCPTIEVVEDNTEPVKPIKENREERRSVLEGISELIPPEYLNVRFGD